MVGTLPKTRLLLANGSVIVGHFDNYTQIGVHLGAKVGDDGHVYIGSEKQHPGYIMMWHDSDTYYTNRWETKEEVLRDWCSRHMKLPSGYSIYRYLT